MDQRHVLIATAIGCQCQWSNLSCNIGVSHGLHTYKVFGGCGGLCHWHGEAGRYVQEEGAKVSRKLLCVSDRMSIVRLAV